MFETIHLGVLIQRASKLHVGDKMFLLNTSYVMSSFDKKLSLDN